MKTEHPEVPWLEASFFENQRNFPPEELAKYAGQHIAWNWEGNRILGSDPDEEKLWQKLEAASIDPSRVVFGYVDPPDTVHLQ